MTKRFLYRLTFLYLAVPNIIFAIGWLKPVWSVLLVGAIIIGFGYFWKHTESETTKIPWIFVILAIIIAFLWCRFSGTGGYGYLNFDYKATNALHKALVISDIPLYIQYGGQTVPIVYYLGHFLPAVLVGKLLGWAASLNAIYLWTWTGVTMMLLWIAHFVHHKMPSNYFVFMCISFILWGGADAIGLLFDTIFHIPILAIQRWAPILEYSGLNTMLFWIPHQALYAWLVTALTIEALRHQKLVFFIPLYIALLILYSPFSVLGLAIFLAPTLIESIGKGKIVSEWMRWFTTLPTGIILVLVGSFILSNAFRFPFYFMPLRHGPIYFLYALGIYLIELGPSLWILWMARKYITYTKVELFILRSSIAVLLLIPYFMIGYANDFAMRSSIPSLIILFLFTLRSLYALISQGTNRQKYIALLTLCLCGYVAVFEIRAGIIREKESSAAFDQVLTITEAEPYPNVLQRMGNPDALFWKVFAKGSKN